MVIKALKNKKYCCLLVAVVIIVILPSFYLHVCFAQSTDNSSSAGYNNSSRVRQSSDDPTPGYYKSSSAGYNNSSVSSADADWTQAVSVDFPAVKSDIDGLMKVTDTNAIVSPEYWHPINETFRIYSVALMTDSQIALNHSKASTVSSELEYTKTAYENAMMQAYYAGFYAHKYVTEAGGNKTEAVNDLNSTNKYITSYKTYIDEADRLYMIYYQATHY